MQWCRVCTQSHSAANDAALAEGTSWAHSAGMYSLGVGTIARHWEHLPPTMQAMPRDTRRLLHVAHRPRRRVERGGDDRPLQPAPAAGPGAPTEIDQLIDSILREKLGRLPWESGA
jgi:hypothetical protein